jgi:predicted transcriptional regulator
MPAERVSMRQIREVLRLRFASELPQRAIAKSLMLSQGAVSGYLSFVSSPTHNRITAPAIRQV